VFSLFAANVMVEGVANAANISVAA
jgi:hypothetical protein